MYVYSQVNEYIKISEDLRSVSVKPLIKATHISTLSNFFSNKASGQSEPNLTWLRQQILFSHGHITNMATTSVYDKEKSFSKFPPEQKDWWPWNVAYSIRYYQALGDDAPGMTLTFYSKIEFAFLCFLWFSRNNWIL